MENNTQKNVNLGDLARELLGLLQKTASTPPWTVKEKTGKWPEIEQPIIQQMALQLASKFDEATEKVNESYIKRGEDIKQVYAGRRRVAVVNEKDKFIVAGRVTDKTTGVGLPNVKVNAFDMDRKYDDWLGSANTDELGYFQIEYTSAQFKDFGEGMPETYLEVIGENKKILYTSPKSFAQKAGKSEYFEVQVEGVDVPTSLAAGKMISGSVEERLKTLDRRKRFLAYRIRG